MVDAHLRLLHLQDAEKVVSFADKTMAKYKSREVFISLNSITIYLGANSDLPFGVGSPHRPLKILQLL